MLSLRAGVTTTLLWIATSVCTLVLADKPNVTKHHVSDVIELREFRSSSTPVENAPVVLLIPGGGWVTCEHDAVKPFAELLCEMGYSAWSTNYRLAPTFPKSKDWAVDHPRYAVWPAQLEDVQTSVWWLRQNAKRLNINPDRVIAIGFSAGGMLAAHLACHDVRDRTNQWSSKVHAAVCVSGPWDLRDVLIAAKTNRQDDAYPDPSSLGITMTLFGGTPDTLREGTRPSLEEAWQASPMSFIDKDISPILLLHGTKDRLVPVFQAQRAHAEIERVAPGKSTLMLSDAGHEVLSDYFEPLVTFLKRVQ